MYERIVNQAQLTIAGKDKGDKFDFNGHCVSRFTMREVVTLRLVFTSA